MIEHEIRALNCPKCDAKITIDITIERGYSDHEKVNCPLCNTFIGEIRADMGYEIINVLDRNGLVMKGYKKIF